MAELFYKDESVSRRESFDNVLALRLPNNLTILVNQVAAQKCRKRPANEPHSFVS